MAIGKLVTIVASSPLTNRPPLAACPQVPLATRPVSAVLHVSKTTVERKSAQVRAALLASAAALPYASSVTPRNLASHARTIMRLGGMLAAVAEPRRGEGEAGAIVRVVSPPPEGAEGLVGKLAAAGVERRALGRSGAAAAKRARIEEKKKQWSEGGGVGGGDELQEGEEPLTDADVEEYLRRPEEVRMLGGPPL